MTVAELLARNAGAESEAAPPVEDSKFAGLVSAQRRLEADQHQLQSSQRRLESTQQRFARDLGDLEHREAMKRARPPEPSVHAVLHEQFIGRDAMLLKIQKEVNDLTILTKKQGYRIDKLEQRLLDLEQPDEPDEDESFADRLRRHLPVHLVHDEEEAESET